MRLFWAIRGSISASSISLFDLLTRFHREIGDLTRDLGPHIHLLDGLQYATGEHRLLHILSGNRCGQYRVPCVCLARPAR